jgi:shikimate kinase
MVPYWNVVREARAIVVVVKDDPVNILDRIIFYDDESQPISRELTTAEREHYLDEIKQDIRYFARSYSKADLAVLIEGSSPGEAAEKIKTALDSLIERNDVNPE